MKIAVMGAGAVGCFFGALLQRAGHEVELIVRPALVEAVSERGLRLSMAEFDGLLPLRATTKPQAVSNADLVLFCVKSGDTETAGAYMRPFLASSAQVLCLQNGVDNAQRLSNVLGRAVFPAAVYVACAMQGPGHVVHHGRGELVIGDGPGCAALAAVLTAAAIPTLVDAQVVGALWTKLVINCACNALSALTQQPYGVLVRSEGMLGSMQQVVEECARVAAAAGVELPPDLWARVLSLTASMPNQCSSTAQDLARGKPSEIDWINGYVVRQGDRLGVPVPLNRVLHALVKARDCANLGTSGAR